MPKTLRLILGDQLNLHHSWFYTVDKDVLYVLMEVKQEQEYVKHHIQKILGFFAAMRNFAYQLKSKGHAIHYIKLNDNGNEQSFSGNLSALIRKYAIGRFE
ncbi:MAG: cryptochrome/photolyase family protein, partial [Bacteroidetes bacterium]|nr:cryptochrome/photolyase family protein [Bacteroidota bacterium]